jgi:riboflavin kinase/FMN adenylyltransferase
MERMGIDLAYVVHFTPDLSRLSPEKFIEHFILRLNIKQVVTGFDFRFGQQGKGNVETLTQWSNQYGDFLFHCVHKIKLDEEKISSTRVRSLLEKGEVTQVIQLLGRPYRITGKVVTGERRGRTIGFPTANLSLEHPYVVPKLGVYAVQAILNGRQIPGVVNIGRKPTFHPAGQTVSIEAHLFDFCGDIYGELLSLDFIHFLREERKFPSTESLQEQINRDVLRAKQIIMDSTNR